MCGIVGMLVRDNFAVDEQLLSRMRDQVAYRGPDEARNFIDDPLGFGFRRLSIIDLSTGSQPMTTPDGRYTIIFNGEIYNYHDLRPVLEKKYVFRTKSDTEVLLYHLVEHGVEGISALNGMFAFALWDTQTQELLIARDRFGKKPLYYADTPRAFLFASEPKSLLVHPGVGRELDLSALTKYFLYEYVPTPATPYRAIRRLPRGHAMKVSRGAVKVESWVKSDSPAKSVTQLPEALQRFDSLLEAAVARRLSADVPLGLFLSGGFDSTTVGWYMRKQQKEVHSFSVQFSERSFDESQYAQAVAKALGTHHTEIPFGRKEFEYSLGQVQELSDEPLGDASLLPTFYLAEQTRKNITVALTGDGGDEMMYGYNTFLAHQLARWYERVPAILQQGLAAAAARMPTRYTNISLDYQAKRFTDAMRYPWYIRNQAWIGSFAQHELTTLLSPQLTPYLATLHEDIEGFMRGLANGNSLDQLLALYQAQYLQDDLLVKTDRATMYNGLEARCPFLDPMVMNFASTLPLPWKFRGGKGKWLLRELMRDRIPTQVLSRKKKGFGIPIGMWMRDWFRNQVESTLAPESIAQHGFWEPEEVKRLIEEHMSGKADNRKKLWTMLTFQWWWQRWAI